MEIQQVVDQHAGAQRQRVVEFMKAHAKLLAEQGAVVASFRCRGGVTLGPYYRLAYRVGGRQKSLYLGADAEFVDNVREILRQHQKPERERRALCRQEKAVRRNLADCKRELRRELAIRGLRLQGNEVRGWRTPGRRSVIRNGNRKGGADHEASPSS